MFVTVWFLHNMYTYLQFSYAVCHCLYFCRMSLLVSCTVCWSSWSSDPLWTPSTRLIRPIPTPRSSSSRSTWDWAYSPSRWTPGAPLAATPPRSWAPGRVSLWHPTSITDWACCQTHLCRCCRSNPRLSLSAWSGSARSASFWAWSFSWRPEPWWRLSPSRSYAGFSGFRATTFGKPGSTWRWSCRIDISSTEPWGSMHFSSCLSC